MIITTIPTMQTITLPITKSLIKYENLLCNKNLRKHKKKCMSKGATGKIDIVMVDLMKIMKSLKEQSYLMIEIYLKYYLLKARTLFLPSIKE